ncbi:MAG: hypothetical protein ACRDRZ_00970 [Pseudonocardiaceae bacterium]
MTPEDGAREVTTVQDRLVVLARYRPGVAGEAARTVHVVPHPGPMDSGAVTALCGALLACEEIETVAPGDGLPCTRCLLLGSSSTPQPSPAALGESGPEVTGVSFEPVAAVGCYRAWGWPVTTRGDHHQAVALLIPTDLASQVRPTLATRQRPAPVLAHPDAPGHRVFLAGEPFGAEPCREIDLCVAACTALRPPPAPRPPTAPGQHESS